AELRDLSRSGNFAERIADEDGAGDLLLEHVAAVRHDGGHAGAHRVALHDRRVADADALDVGDRVECAGGIHAGSNPQIASPRLRRLRAGRPDRSVRGPPRGSKPIQPVHVASTPARRTRPDSTTLPVGPTSHRMLLLRRFAPAALLVVAASAACSPSPKPPYPFAFDLEAHAPRVLTTSEEV